ncbi:MAG TPA: H-X9-DG-CTERM domain-containing protein, partial [Armatimonadota bacterium]
MWVQDHDETFPNAATWVSDLAATYGVTGKVWDCPTTSFKGTESAPDYFYVGGSFLSGAALGDVKDPAAAPFVGDLANGKSKKPYVEDGGDTDLGIAAATADPRHNNGAVFAFVDGHVTWAKAADISPAFFAPSVVVTDPSQMFLGKFILYSASSPTTQKGPHGMPYHSEYQYNGQWNMYDDCQPLVDGFGFSRISEITVWGGRGSLVKGMTTADTTNATDNNNMPSWLNKTASLPEIPKTGNATSTVQLCWGFYGSYTVCNYNNCLSPLVSATTAGSVNKTLTLMPASSGIKRVGIFVLKNTAGNASVLVNSVTTQGKIYNTTLQGKPYSTACNLDMSSAGYGFGLLMYVIPMSVNQPVVFNITATDAGGAI